MYQNTAAVIAGSRHTAGEVPAAHRSKVVWIPENAIDPKRFNRIARPYDGGPLRAVFIGRLVPYKGADMLVEAAAPFLRDGKMRLDIIGDGPMRGALTAQVQSLGLADRVIFHGQLPHEAVQDIAAECHILPFPSVREFGGGVVLEAMALGIVPVVVDYAGPGELVGPETGYKIPIGSRGDIVSELNDTLAGILKSPDALADKASAARARVAADFTWHAKALQVGRVYDWVLGKETDKPVRLTG